MERRVNSLFPHCHFLRLVLVLPTFHSLFCLYLFASFLGIALSLNFRLRLVYFVESIGAYRLCCLGRHPRVQRCCGQGRAGSQ